MALAKGAPGVNPI